MKTLIVGDTHGDARFVANVHRLARTSESTDDPARAVVQLGDFGFGFDRNMMGSICAWLDRHPDNKWYWIDGNHDNHDRLDALTAEHGKRYPISMTEYHERLFYVPRGAIFVVGGTLCMGFGGAYSIDKRHRKPHVSWWPQEMPTKGDVYRAIQNFEEYGADIDVMFTHDAPCSDHLESWLAEFGHKVGRDSKDSRLLVTEVVEAVRPQRLFHGHYHQEYSTTYGRTRVQGVGANTRRTIRGEVPCDKVRVGDNVLVEDF